MCVCVRERQRVHNWSDWQIWRDGGREGGREGARERGGGSEHTRVCERVCVRERGVQADRIRLAELDEDAFERAGDLALF